MSDVEGTLDLKLPMRRKLHFRWGDNLLDGELKVGGLERVGEAKWACSWSISLIHPDTAFIYGEDPLDALRRCLRMIEELVRGSIEDGIQVWWKVEGDCGGF